MHHKLNFSFVSLQGSNNKENAEKSFLLEIKKFSVNTEKNIILMCCIPKVRPSFHSQNLHTILRQGIHLRKCVPHRTLVAPQQISPQKLRVFSNIIKPVCFPMLSFVFFHLQHCVHPPTPCVVSLFPRSVATAKSAAPSCASPLVWARAAVQCPGPAPPGRLPSGAGQAEWPTSVALQGCPPAVPPVPSHRALEGVHASDFLGGLIRALTDSGAEEP